MNGLGAVHLCFTYETVTWGMIKVGTGGSTLACANLNLVFTG